MPILTNQRHERFAQELAKGESASKAYELAGYNPDRGAASRLSANVSVQARVQEILGRAAARAEVTVASITDRLLKIAEKGESSREPALLSVSRASLMDVAKLNGLIVEKRELAGRNGGPIEYANLTEAEIDTRLAAAIAGDAGADAPEPEA